MVLSCIISDITRDIARKSRFFHTHCRLRYWGFRWTVSVSFGMEKLEWCGYPMVKNIEDTFTRLDREYTNVTDGRTDRQTPHDGIGLAYALPCAAKMTRMGSLEI